MIRNTLRVYKPPTVLLSSTFFSLLMAYELSLIKNDIHPDELELRRKM